MTVKTKIPTPPKLTNKQIRFLRGLGHHLSALVMLGKSGINDEVVNSIAANLAAHELIKIKIQQTCPIDRHEAAEQLPSLTGAAVAQVLGKTILLYRPNKKRPKDQQIRLPK